MALLDRKALADSIKTLSTATDALAKGLAKVDAMAQKSSGFDKMSKAAKDAGGGIQKVADVLGHVRDIGKDAFAGVASGISSLTKGDTKAALDGLVESVAALSKSLDLLVPGLGEATAAIIKFGGAGVNAMYSLGERIIDENNKLTILNNQFNSLGSHYLNENGPSMLNHFADLSSYLPGTRAQLAGMSEDYIELGFSGDKLVSSIEAQSAAAAMLGERGGRAYKTLAERAFQSQRSFTPMTASFKDLAMTGVHFDTLAKEMGISVENLNARLRFGAPLGLKFGEALDKALKKDGKSALDSLMTMTTTSMAKMAEKIGMLFQFSEKESREGIDKFGTSLSHFGDLFDQSTESGKILHDTIHDFAETVLPMVGTALEGARIGFKMLETVFLTVETKTHPLRRSLTRLGKAFGKSDKRDVAMKTFQSYLSMIGDSAAFASKSITSLVDATTKLVSIANSFGEGKGSFKSKLASIATGQASGFMLPGHAAGGVVTGISGGIATVRAADGEGLASIGRGERIVPANDAGSKGGWNVTLMPGAVVVQGGSSQSQGELTESAISLMFERIRLKQGLA